MYSRERRVCGDDEGGSVDVGVGMGGLSSIEETDSVLVEEGTEEEDEVLEARDERFGASNTAPKDEKSCNQLGCNINSEAEMNIQFQTCC